jgi:XTP/dITP diphosphohydrolase
VTDPRLVLIETASALPGLLPVAAHVALGQVSRVFARDPEHHTTVPYLQAAGIEVAPAPEGDPGPVVGLNLLGTAGEAADVRRAKGLIAAATAGDIAYLLGPEDEAFSRTVGIEAARAGLEVEYVFLVGAPRGLELLHLVDVMAHLRHPETGCPWDLEQDHASLARYLMEETYEALDAIDRGDDAHLAEELGDVLLQIVFHAQIAADRRAFDIDDVARGIATKLVRRHPHVFADGDASTPAEVQANWDKLKAAEKTERTGPFDGVPTALPALMLAEELQRKAAKLGFDWDGPAGPAAKVREELDEVLAADGDAQHDELGDLLLAVVGLARKLGIEPEVALRRAANDFRARFEAVLSRATTRGLEPSSLGAAEWRELWDEAKAAGF